MKRNLSNIFHFIVRLIGRKHILLSGCSYTLLSIIEVSCLYFIGFTLGEVLNASDNSTFNQSSNLNSEAAIYKLLIITIFVVLAGFFRILVTWYNLYLSAKTASKLNDIVQSKIVRGITYGKLDMKTSEAISILIDQIDRINACFIQTFFNVTGNSITCIFLGLFAASRISKLALIPVLITILIYIFIILINKKTLLRAGDDINSSVFNRIAALKLLFDGGREIYIRQQENSFNSYYKKEERRFRFSLLKTNFIAIYPKYILETIFIILVVSSITVLNFIPSSEKNIYLTSTLIIHH